MTSAMATAGYCASLILWVLLWRRVKALESIVRPLRVSGNPLPERSQIAPRLFHILGSVTTLLETRTTSIDSCPVRYAENQGPYHVISELTTWIAKQPPPGTVHDAQKLIGALYRLQYELNLSDEAIHPLVSESAQQVTRTNAEEQPLEYEIIAKGQPVNLKRMLPINQGTTVQQPLGVVFCKGRDVLSKSKVVCA